MSKEEKLPEALNDTNDTEEITHQCDEGACEENKRCCCRHCQYRNGDDCMYDSDEEEAGEWRTLRNRCMMMAAAVGKTIALSAAATATSILVTSALRKIFK